MNRLFKIIPVIILLAIVILHATEPVKKQRGLSKPAVDDPLLSRARAYLDKGKLKIAVHNFGRFCGISFPEGQWGNFTYIPNIDLMVGVPGKDKNGNPYPWAVGKKKMYMLEDQQFRNFGGDSTYWGPTVSESWMDRTYPNYNRTDWESKEESQIFLHNPLVTAGEYYGSKGLYTYPEDQYPLIATSDIPETWPKQGEDRVWPGPYAIDPGDTSGTNELEGVFVSDQDIYFEFDDRFATRDIDTTQGYSIGIRAVVSGYSYSASISEDIIFFRMYLINESEYHYEGVYGGFYFDADGYNTDLNGYRWRDTNLDDMMGYNTGLDYGYIYDLRHGSAYPEVGDERLGYAAVKLLETPKATENVDLNGDGGIDIMQNETLGLTSWHWFDWYVRPGANDQPPNNYSGDGRTPYRANKEEIQYKIMAGDTSNLDNYDSKNYFHPEKIESGGVLVDGKLNPRFDSIKGLQLLHPDGLDCVFIMASGPFSMAPGDSVPFSFCVLMGEDTTDLRVNAEIAQLMYDNNYQGARAPTAPKVFAKESDEKVNLFWDGRSVNSEDIITGYKDFEGFRIYKSTDNGKTWGKQYYDEESRMSYWEPIAQFDLENEISGYETIKPHRYLGNNSGLQFKFEDTDVENGKEYLYAVCAYDRGYIYDDPLHNPDNLDLRFDVPSLENFLSNSTHLDHIVKAVPHRPASNTELKNIRVERLPGTVGSGQFDVEVISIPEITGDTYEILFDIYTKDVEEPKTLKDSLRFSVVNTITGDTVIAHSNRYAIDEQQLDELPIFHGLRMSIRMSSEIAIYSEDVYWSEGSQCTYQLDDLRLSQKTRSDYEIRFLGADSDTVFSLRDFYRDSVKTELFKVPFQIWNTATNKKALVLAPPNSESFNPDVTFRVVESDLPEEYLSDGLTTLQLSFNWSKEDAPWQAGDVMIIPVRKPFEDGDGFRVQTDKLFVRESVNEGNISEVKVVPNPYLVHAEWESDDFVRKLQFTNLPDQCKIHIYTVAGEKVITLYHDSAFDGSENWDLLTMNRQEAAPGLYIYVIEAENGQTHTGKFAIIK